ncbi:M26 peptidase [Pontimonas salivibrio]|uniref:M26 peptidase n=1 Tax=Pontimonas salivibrio TaxID=1159327 RepID=A0A2L2BRS2_9MICO|nr:M26 peptidase [Pontimonas salivibrio]
MCRRGTRATQRSVAPSGDGTSGSPYEIASPDNLVWLSWAASADNTGSDPSRADALGASYRQTVDIDLGGCEWKPIGEAVLKFTGSYNGQGNIVKNPVVAGNENYAGFFGYLASGGVLSNIGLVDVDVSGRLYAGGLVGRLDSATVSGAFVSGSVEAWQKVGGLVGYSLSASRVTDSYSTASVGGFRLVLNDGRTFDPADVGGLIGQADGASHDRLFSIGAVSAVDGVTHTDFGGFAGSGKATTNSFWNSETSLQSTSAAGEGKTTDEMTSLATFNDTATEGLDAAWGIVDGWEAYDFDTPTNVWGICSRANDGYPFLLWEYTEDPCVVPDSGGGGDTGRNDDDDDDTVAAAVTPAPAVTAPVRPRVAEAAPAPTTTVEGPVWRGGVVSAPPRVPTVLVGGVPTIVEESSPDPTTLSVVAGSLSLGVSVDGGSGGVSRSDDGLNRLSVKAGSVAVLQGAGLEPGASVQVFIPLGVDDSRELASITVAADGTFSGELPVSTDPLAEPLPIGERLLQLVSVDADGNQVVLEMAVNVAQGDPAPALDRDAGDIPVVEPGATAVTSAGVVTEATTTALPDQNIAVVEGDT